MVRCIALVLALFAALPCGAIQPDTVDALVERFAVCQGRFAAMRGTAWPVAGMPMATGRVAARFDELFAAIGPVPQDRSPGAVRLRRTRAEAQTEQARLLAIAVHSPDTRRAHRAGLTLDERLRVCAAMVTG